MFICSCEKLKNCPQDRQFVKTHHTTVLPYAPDDESATNVIKEKESNDVTHKKRET
jgi:hypothetical protein